MAAAVIGDPDDGRGLDSKRCGSKIALLPLARYALAALGIHIRYGHHYPASAGWRQTK